VPRGIVGHFVRLGRPARASCRASRLRHGGKLPAVSCRAAGGSPRGKNGPATRGNAPSPTLTDPAGEFTVRRAQRLVGEPAVDIAETFQPLLAGVGDCALKYLLTDCHGAAGRVVDDQWDEPRVMDRHDIGECIRRGGGPGPAAQRPCTSCYGAIPRSSTPPRPGGPGAGPERVTMAMTGQDVFRARPQHRERRRPEVGLASVGKLRR